MLALLVRQTTRLPNYNIIPPEPCGSLPDHKTTELPDYKIAQRLQVPEITPLKFSAR